MNDPRGPFPDVAVPFETERYRLRMGLRPLDLSTWIEVDRAFDEQIELKRSLYSRQPPVVATWVDAPGVVEAATELHRLLDAHLAESHGRRAEPLDGWAHPIEAVGLSTQEDWCLLAPVEGELVLGAASVCFPTRWVLSEKIGLSTRAIHGPVPLYDEQLADPVDHFMDRLSVDRPIWRLNWNLCDDGRLHQPYNGGRQMADDADADDEPLTVDEVGDRVWLRVERQTLRRLPRSGTIAFGIRVHHQPLSETAVDAARLEALRLAVGLLPQSAADYKGLPAFGEQLAEWLRQRLDA